ncbi:hypothetical protein BCR42DRAFT_412548 [Absidia repens]|uniref:BHLH domain-containing protein n=1 Tax=Absidia repens TaxID=90262 RepID=A0A1X2IJS9_9FUNG|nr:hypothetical protein BCR42DRAFT_412548 [Absidia repens]
MSTAQSTQMCGIMDPAYYQQQQQTFQVSPQQIQRLRHLQQQAALQQQPGYPQQQQQQMLAMPQYQPQQPQTYQQPIHSSVEHSDPTEMAPNKASKRAEHNAIERARREHLNTKFQQLAHSLPNLQNDRRPSKGTIIERTLEFVKHTVQKEERYKNEIKELSRANRQLMRQVTSRSSLFADSSSSHSGDEEEDDMVAVAGYYQMEDDMMDNTSSDDSISRKSSCSSFAMQSMSTTNGTSSTTTSPSLEYHSVLSQWDNPQHQPQQYCYQQQQQQQQHFQQQPDMYLSSDDLMNDNYLLTDGGASFFNPMKSSMDAMNNNNLHIKYESSFHG